MTDTVDNVRLGQSYELFRNVTQESIEPDNNDRIHNVKEPEENLGSKTERDKSKERSKADVSSSIDVLIVTALPEENEAIKKYLFGESPVLDEQRGGQYFSVADIISGEAKARVAATCFSEMGMVSAAILTTRALASIKPKLVIMSGICAGVAAKTNIGDIVIGSDIFNYDSMKRTPKENEADYAFVIADWRLKNIVNSLIQKEGLCDLIEKSWSVSVGKPPKRIKAIMAPFASGSSVAADPKVFEEIKEHQRRVAGLDMEAYGVAKAVHYESDIKLLVAKSVADHGDLEKGLSAPPSEVYREFCCFASAMFAKQVIMRSLEDSMFIRKTY